MPEPKRHDSGETTRPIPAEILRRALEEDAAHHVPEERPTRPARDHDPRGAT